MSHRLLFIALAASVALSGCQTCRRVDFTSNRRSCCNGCGDAGAGIRLAPVPRFQPQPPRQPPIARLDSPQPATYLEPVPRDTSPPVANVPSPNRDEPPEAPEDAPPSSSLSPAILKPPVPYRQNVARPPAADTKEPPIANVPPKNDSNGKQDQTARLLNIKIALTDVSSGLEPDEKEVGWLKRKGYKTLIRLHAPDAKEDAAERLAPSDVRVHSLVASAAELKQETFDEFVKLVDNKDNRPLYVYDDRGGPVVGGMWYLYFHLHKGESDADARAKVKRLGLDFDDKSDAHISMNLRIQAFVRDYKR